MINIYPANRLENLIILFDKVIQTSATSNILNEEIILVQSKGMQHWLNLKLAEKQGISMNLAFSLPMQFFWNQIRAILGKDKVPEQSSYSREVLSWRIDALLASEEVINNDVYQEASNYWRGPQGASSDKRFQLACQLADLFEQYLIFRPDWISGWDKGQADCLQGREWQALLWQLLAVQEPQHPIVLLQEAIDVLKTAQCHLPERISLFGINTLPPLWLEFLSELGNQTQVHFFHLNPCVEYWGDLKTDKAQAREQFYRWLKAADKAQIVSDTEQNIALNPLLSNLGAQGIDFLYLLQEHTSIEIPVFESPDEIASEAGKKANVLQSIQSDILNLYNRRLASDKDNPFIDNSIIIASAHSALREIQALHDWLLQQINNDETLNPRDILVMCPNVENYAPYVEAVFAHGWYDWSERVPPLPCSIADRTLKESEPLVQAFIDLLELPDQRFQVSQILAYLRLPAVQHKFSFAEDDLLLLERWVNHAAIHWGLDARHKQQILQVEQSNNKFSWQQGLDRLLLGFAQGDQESLYHEQLLLPDVEGDEALLLGRYFELLEQLQYYARELDSTRTPEQWQRFLLQARENLFSSLADDSSAQQTIEQAIEDLGEYTRHAHYNKKIPLVVIRDFLQAHFNQPEPGRQFMAGQVTFCSMIPMRSVPFRVIAVLGLNEGEFPRQRQPMGFDLMAAEPPRKGDRSRRGDDRYLFLEALISCRDKLYLSYQGHDIKTNNVREPSLVLQELMDYLYKGYGWSFFEKKDDNNSQEETQEQLLQIPMQAFSSDNYLPDTRFKDKLQNNIKKQILYSFNANWLKLIEPGQARNNLYKLTPMADELADEMFKFSLDAEQLIQFFDNPCKQFAHTRLGLFFNNTQQTITEDSEPFMTNHLDRYLIQEAIINTVLEDDSGEQEINQLMTRFKLSGQLPDTPRAEDDLLQWQEQACDFTAAVKKLTHSPIIYKSVEVLIGDIKLKAELPMVENHLLFWRLATPKGKDDMRLWIHHLIAQIYYQNKAQQQDKRISTYGLFRGKKEKTLLQVKFKPVDSAYKILSQLLECWQEGMQQPLLLNAALGQKHCRITVNAKKQSVVKPLNNLGFYSNWQDNFQTAGLGSDPYVHWFWGGAQAIPQWEGDWQTRIEAIYRPLYDYRKELAFDEE